MKVDLAIAYYTVLFCMLLAPFASARELTLEDYNSQGRVNVELSQDGEDFNLMKQKSLVFVQDSRFHIVTLQRIKNDAAIISIDSAARFYEIAVGDSMRFDLDQDKNNDLSIEVRSFKGITYATLGIKILSEKAIDSQIQDSADIETTDAYAEAQRAPEITVIEDNQTVSPTIAQVQVRTSDEEALAESSVDRVAVEKVQPEIKPQENVRVVTPNLPQETVSKKIDTVIEPGYEKGESNNLFVFSLVIIFFMLLVLLIRTDIIMRD